ncbi:MAG: multicopper oxidase domain-containing protein [Actinomycetota bacterium]|nr:multicopper oxidase domain-containing protein [Actinomycetota bacterium]
MKGLAIGAAVVAVVAAFTGAGFAAQGADRKDARSPTVPTTPSVSTDLGVVRDGAREFDLTASEFSQQIANFPIKTARFWGYNGSTPGPTLVAYEGEAIRVVLDNQLSVPTTVHLHGLHQPNEFDGVAGISQPDPVKPGGTFTYGPFTPRHTGSFSYHSHTTTAVQDLRGLDGMIVILPKKESKAQRVDKDFVMTLQQFAPPGEGELVAPFPPGTGDFPFSTINGKTGEASGGPMVISKGDRVRIRLYNASNLAHSMHLHGHDMVLVSKNGHPVPKVTETTQNVAPGDFFEIEFTADNPGNWVFHCHVPHHTSNKMMDGFNGGPVGMTRVFHYEGAAPVPPGYFAYEG